MMSRNSGVWYAVAAFVAWGFLPLYWKVLKHVPAEMILSHRIFWSFVFLAVIITFRKRWESFKKILKNWRQVAIIFTCTVLLSVNWLVYIWAVNNNQIIETSMGYYINPLLSVLLGMVVLKEKLNFWQLIAVFLATVGVMTITLQYGRIPWIALSLAVSFSIYGLLKKMTGLDSLTSLALETMMAAPVALALIIGRQWDGSGGHASLLTTILFLGAGPVTALPLLWFARAAQSIKLSTVGFTQYMTPTITLLLGVFAFGEPFTGVHLVSFGFIWFAILLFFLSQSNLLSKWQPNYFKEPPVFTREGD